MQKIFQLFGLKQLSFSKVCKGAFKNYVEQMLPNFNPPPPSRGQKWTIYILSLLCHVTPSFFSMLLLNATLMLINFEDKSHKLEIKSFFSF